MKKTFVIGITGGSASGKSTLSKMIADDLNGIEVMVMHMDNYFLPKESLPRSKAHITGETYVDYNQPLSIDLEKFKLDLEEAIKSCRYQVIIVEGLFVLSDDEICDKLDLKLFVDCRTDERITRRLKRNMQEWKQSFDEISKVYLDLVRYRHDEYVEPYKWRADLIINGSKPFGKSVCVIHNYICNLVNNEIN